MKIELAIKPARFIYSEAIAVQIFSFYPEALTVLAITIEIVNNIIPQVKFLPAKGNVNTV